MVTRVKMLRLERELKGFDVAMATGVHPSVISHDENRRSKASENVRKTLSNFYQTEERNLFDDEFFAI